MSAVSTNADSHTILANNFGIIFRWRGISFIFQK